jgi:hypothetical protein
MRIISSSGELSPLTHAVGERVRERGMVPSAENPLSLALSPAKSG